MLCGHVLRVERMGTVWCGEMHGMKTGKVGGLAADVVNKSAFTKC